MRKLFILLFAFLYSFNLFAQSGMLDSSFAGTGIVLTDVPSSVSDLASSIALQQDGKILVAGTAWNDFTDYNVFVVRYNDDGSIDSSFGDQGVARTAICNCEDAGDIAVQDDGKIVVAGSINHNDSLDIAIYRFNENGILDSTFGTNGYVTIDDNYDTDAGQSLAIQSDGKIVVAGSSADDFLIIRCNEDGTLDNTFGYLGKVLTQMSLTGYSVAYEVAIQPDGKIVAAGKAGSIVGVARYNSDGSLDNTFDGDGKVTTDNNPAANGLAIQSDGKIVVAGATATDFVLIRYNSDGSLDGTLSGDGIQTTTIGYSDILAGSVNVLPDNRIVVAGYANPDFSTSDDFAIVRYDEEGNPDTDFGANGIVRTDFAGYADHGWDAKIQSDGKIVVVGFVTTQPNTQIGMARYLEVCPLITADFSYSASNLTVSFTDQSSGANQWYWDFNDGSTSALSNPQHTFPTSGTYDVCLVANNVCSTDTYCLYIAVCDTAVSDFYYFKNGLSIQCYSNSVNANWWHWDFGQGGTSTEVNPFFSYSLPGNYNVCLVAGSDCSADTFCQVISITTDTTCAANFTLVADPLQTGLYYGYNLSSGDNLKYFWDWGDGETGTGQFPSHTYADSGAYNICLMILDTFSNCTDTFCDDWYILKPDEMMNVHQIIFVDYPLPNPTVTPASYLQVYPNPMEDAAVIKFALPSDDFVELSLIDQQGKEIKSITKKYLTNGIHQVDLLTDGLSKGLYFLQLKTGKEVFIEKIIIE